MTIDLLTAIFGIACLIFTALMLKDIDKRLDTLQSEIEGMDDSVNKLMSLLNIPKPIKKKK